MERKYENFSMDDDGDFKYSFLQQRHEGPVLQNFVTLSLLDERLDAKHIDILNYLLKNPDKTAIDVYKFYSNRFKNHRTPSNHVKRLYEKKLLELVVDKQELIKGTKTKYSKPYRLSLSGIFYEILNTFNITYEDLILSLLNNYENNILFTLFLYPFMKEQTLLDCKGDSAVFSNIALYLRNVCNVAVDCIGYLRNMAFTTPDGYRLEQVLVWYKDPSSNVTPNFCAVNLRNFLMQTFNWSWIDKAKITTNANENLIEILDTSNPENKAHISINKDDRKAVLRQGGIKLYEFSINPNDSFLSIEAKTDRKVIDCMETPLFYRCREHLLVLLTNLRTQVTKHNPSFDILSKDENFRKALKYLDRESKLA